MGYNIEIGDSIVIVIGDKALSGKVIDTRDNSVGNHVIELELHKYCGYKLVLEQTRSEEMIKELTILQKDLDFIQIQLEINKPYEACGVITGTISNTMAYAKKVIPIKNVRRTEASFELDPQQFYDAWNLADKDGYEIVGIYHTHPFYSSRPSSWDINTMKNVSSIWLIAGLDGTWGYIYDKGVENVQIWTK